MKLWGAFVGTVAVVLVLAGCTAQAESEPGSSAAAASTPTATAQSTTDANDAAFVQKVRATSPNIGYTDSELVAYGVIACAQLTSGSAATNITVLPSAGSSDNALVVDTAKQILCP